MKMRPNEAIAYSMGQTWIERPGDSHTLTQNLSDTESSGTVWFDAVVFLEQRLEALPLS